MQLGGNLRPSNNEELRAARIQALDDTAPSQQSPVGVDEQGHQIKPVDASSSRKSNIPASGVASDHSVAVTQVSITAEEAVENLAQNVEETTQLARVLESFFETAPMMACLRALNLGGLSPESTKLFEANRGTALGEKKLIPNNSNPPIRLAILVPGKMDEWTSIVPPVIPAGIKTHAPDEHGQWSTMQAPDREPTQEEQQEVRSLIQKTLETYIPGTKNKFSEHKKAITINDVNLAMEDFDERNLLSSLESNLVSRLSEDSEVVEKANQHLSSPYVPLLEGLSAAAEFMARSAAVVTTTAVEAAKGGLEGAFYGGVAGATIAVAPTIAMGSAATAALSASAASTVGHVGGAGGGLISSYLGAGAPSKISDTADIEKGFAGAILGSAIGAAAGVVAAHAGVPAVTAVAGAMAGGVMGAINKLPSAIEDSIKYFSPQLAWAKSMHAFSHWDDAGRLIPLMKQANATDEKMKEDLGRFFKPFDQDQKYKKTKDILVALLDQKIAKQTAAMNQILGKLKEQNNNAIPTSGPIGTKRSARIRL